MTAQVTDKQAYQFWYDFLRSFNAGLEVDPFESQADKLRRIRRLEADPEKWFKYYFKKFYTAEPAPFQCEATRRVVAHPEWYEARAWARELAKSARTMMEVCYLIMTRRKRNAILTSNSQDNAERLLAPYRAFFECNERLINDYGEQKMPGNWESGEFRLRIGAAFRAVGAGQSPRGSRNEEMRPDVLLIDDFDTDADCLNPDIVNKKWDWFERALYATRSISTPLLVIFCGNIIAENCCMLRAIEMADHADVINIRDEFGHSVWPSKNSEEYIDRALSKISLKAQQGEYFNNPIQEGKTFKEIRWDRCPALRKFPFLVAYADPATSNKDKKGSCTKAVILMGFCEGRYYVLNCFVDNATTDTFIQWFYDLKAYVGGQAPVYWYIENNSLQTPFYEQVFMPKFAERGRRDGNALCVTPDDRKKGDKFSRIEGTLEPLVRTGGLVFNEDERGNPHMKRLEEQFKAVNPKLSAPCDGVDATEGGVFIIREKITSRNSRITSIPRPRNTKRY